MDLYNQTTFSISELVTRTYSTSFYLSTTLLEKEVKTAIFAVYGFVRFADEIVDSFHEYDKRFLLYKFESDLKEAIEQKISLNPILNSFQQIVHHYAIPYDLIDAFLYSMKLDLEKRQYESKEETEQYIYGSANVVGLMCLKIFSANNDELYERLKNPAMKLGSAFQKVNFLRDLSADINNLERQYFSEYNFSAFDEQAKHAIIAEIQQEFDEAYVGIRGLPGRSKLAVLTAHSYYLHLLKKIRKTPADQVMEMRIRITNLTKFLLILKAMVQYKLKFV